MLVLVRLDPRGLRGEVAASARTEADLRGNRSRTCPAIIGLVKANGIDPRRRAAWDALGRADSRAKAPLTPTFKTLPNSHIPLEYLLTDNVLIPLQHEIALLRVCPAHAARSSADALCHKFLIERRDDAIDRGL